MKTSPDQRYQVEYIDDRWWVIDTWVSGWVVGKFMMECDAYMIRDSHNRHYSEWVEWRKLN